MRFKCRHCYNDLGDPILDLGNQPPSNAYLNKEQLDVKEVTYPLKLYLCNKCWLPQLPEYAKANELFTSDYAYFSSTSSSWCFHAKNYVEKTVKKFNLNKSSFIVEIASNDGYLLQYVKKIGINCIGIEPTYETALEAEKKGIKTVREFFGERLANRLKNDNLIPELGVDLIIANNVLAHVPDINDFIKGAKSILHENGVFSIEFPHLLNLLIHNQFDTIYHEHYSYLSLTFLKRLSRKFGLTIFDVEIINTHGGSLRVWLSREGKKIVSKNVLKILEKEKAFNIETIEIFRNLQLNAEKIKDNFLYFLLNSKINNEIVCGYGAAAKANTLLNFSGVRKDFVKFIVDNSPSKQNKFMPGSLIPIYSADKLEEENIKKIIIFPWNIVEEISKSLKNRDVYTFIPSFKKW